MTEAGRLWGFDGEGKKAHGGLPVFFFCIGRSNRLHIYYNYLGMLKAALRIRHEIEKYGHLSRVMRRSGRRGAADGPLSPDHEAADQRRLVVVGHSLGAGAAVLLSFLLRPIYPDLKCFSFGK